MNYVKTFEGYNRFREAYTIATTAMIGDILDETTIYHYVQHIHDREEDFYDGDLGERIEKCRSYKLMEIDISLIDIEEFYSDEDLVEEYQEEYMNTNTYPPIVLEEPYDGRYTIIDGTHRSQALDGAGVTKIRAFVGQD
jgi:hypothetical protein